MILADDNQILERAAQTDAPTQDQFPKPGPGIASEAFTGNLESTAALPVAAWRGFSAAVDTGADLAHDMLQPGAAHSAASAFQAGVTRAREVDNFTADEYTLRRQYEPVMEAINRDRAPDDQLPNPYDIHLGGYAEAQGVSRPLPNGAMRARDNVIPLVWARVQQMREQAPQLVANVPANEHELMEDVLAEQRTALAWSDMTSKTTLGKAANLIGGFAGSFTDPPNVLASMLGAPASASLLRTFLLEGTLNTALDAAGLPSRAARYRKLGQPMSGGEIGAELGLDFVLGGALPTGIKAGLHSLFPEVRTAARMVEDEANRASENPLADTDLGRDQHRQAALSAMTALEDGRPDQLPDTTGQLQRALNPGIDLERRRSGFVIEAPAEAVAAARPEIRAVALSDDEWRGAVDIARDLSNQSHAWQLRQRHLEFQAREFDVDSAGDWTAAKAPLSIWYENAEGGRYRMSGDGNYGVTLRAADDVTPQMAEAVSSLKRHFDGEESPDLFKHAPPGVEDRPPPNDSLIAARDLLGLDDQAWGDLTRSSGIAPEFSRVRTLPRTEGVRLLSEGARLKTALEDLARQIEATPAGDAEAAERLTRLQAVEQQLSDPDLAVSQRKKLTRRRDEILTNSTPEQLQASAAPLQKRRALENQHARLAESLGEIERQRESLALDQSLTPPELRAVQELAASRANGYGPAAVQVGTGSLSHPPETIPPLDHAALSVFADPSAKPEGFARQSQDLARDLAPAREPAAPRAEDGAAKPPEFGPAQAEIESIRALDQKESFPDPLGDGGEISVRDARRRMEQEARMVEALRKCGGFDGV